jgi:peptidoglycan/LPS O-acetylase OafA/YrhL
LTLLVASCVVREDNDLAPMLRLRPVAWIGTISYGIYLMHMLSISAVRRVLGRMGEASPYWEFLAGAMLSICVASVSYWTFERYFLRLKDQWFADQPGKKLSTGAASAAGAASSPRAAAPS